MLGRRILSWTSLFVQLVRIDKPLASGVLTLVGAYIGGGFRVAISGDALLAAASMTCIVAFCFAINDIRDVEVDRLGKPARPIPSGRLSKSSAGRVAAGLLSTGLALAFPVNLPTLAFAVALSAAGVLYSFRLKNTVLAGNALVGSLIGSVPLFGALAVRHISPQVVVAALLTGFFAFSLEILYTVVDERGDREAGVKTVAVRFGRSRTLALFLVLAAGIVVTAFVPWIVGMTTTWYAVTALLFCVGPVGYVVGVLLRETGPRAVGIAAITMRLASYASFVPLILLRPTGAQL